MDQQNQLLLVATLGTALVVITTIMVVRQTRKWGWIFILLIGIALGVAGTRIYDRLAEPLPSGILNKPLVGISSQEERPEPTRPPPMSNTWEETRE